VSEFNWTCPHCERHVTITYERLSNERHVLWIRNADGGKVLTTVFIICPNPSCRKYTLTAVLNEGVDVPGRNSDLGGAFTEMGVGSGLFEQVFPRLRSLIYPR